MQNTLFKISIHFFLTALLVVFAVGCYDNFENTNTEIESQAPEEFIDGRLIGKLIDQNGTALPNYRLELLGETSNSSSFGYFKFNALMADYHGETITIYSPDNIAYAHLISIEKGGNSYEIVQIDINLEQITIETGQKVAINLDVTKQMRLETGQLKLMNTDETVFNGFATISWNALQSNPSKLKNYPSGIASHKNARGTVTISSILQIEIQDGSKEHLLINKTEGLNWIINNWDMNKNEQLWHFNRELGRWIIQENCQIINDKLICLIDKKGYWAIGRYNQGITLDGELISKNMVIENSTIEISSKQSSFNITVQTNENGNWHCMVPKDEALNIKHINTNEDVFKKIEVGPFNQNQAGIRLETNTDNNFSNINLYTKECESYDLEKSIVRIIHQNNEHFLYAENGKINQLVPITNNSNIQIQANPLSEKNSALIDWRLEPTNNIGSLFLCNSINADYLTIKLENEISIYNINTSTIEAQKIILSSRDANIINKELLLKFPNNGAGILDNEIVNIKLNDMNLGVEGISLSCYNSSFGCGFEEFNLLHFSDKTGDWIRGEFKGEFWTLSTNLNPNEARHNYIEGDFRIRQNF